MNSLHFSLLPGAIAGVISIFTSWFWVGLVFHPFQRSTPQTWRAESALSHALSSLVQVAACIGIATLYVMVARGNGGILGAGMFGAACFAVLGWGAFAAPILLTSLLYVKMHPLFALGRLLSWLTTSLLASLTTAWWLRAL